MKEYFCNPLKKGQYLDKVESYFDKKTLPSFTYYNKNWRLYDLYASSDGGGADD